jgi:hypothetical protein
MKFGVLLRPRGVRSDLDPGHMGVFFRSSGGEIGFRGYYFSPTDLPLDYQKASRWREYLFEKKVPGYVVDDVRLRDDFEYRRESLVSKEWELADDQRPEMEHMVSPGQNGYYSFNPDDFDDCDNCVTWVVGIVNQFVSPGLRPVPQGRIKLMREQLES